MIKDVNVMNNKRKLDWMVIDKNLDITLEGIEEIKEVGDDNINWIYDLLMKKEQITFDDIITYYTQFMVEHITLLFHSVVDEEYCISAKIKKVIDYQTDETLRLSKTHLTDEEVEDVEQLIREIEGERLEMIKNLVDHKWNKIK